MSQLHNCTPGYDAGGNARVFPCPADITFMSAMDACIEDEQGRLWVSHVEIDRGQEYSTQANFCPFCGYRARVQVEWVSPTKINTKGNPSGSLWVKSHQETQERAPYNGVEKAQELYAAKLEESAQFLEDMGPGFCASQDDAP